MNRNALVLVCAVLVASTAQAWIGALPARPAAQSAADTPDARLAALIERHDQKRKEVIEAYGKAETDEERGKILAGLPGKDFAAEFRALAEEVAGTEAAARAWLWTLRLGDDPKQAKEVVDTLLEEYIRFEALAELPDRLRSGVRTQSEARVVEALRSLLAESPHEKVRASALYNLGRVLLQSKEDGKKAEGRGCFEAVIAEYGKVPYGTDSTYRAAAERFLYELDHLQIGMAAPDFETVDENGVAWKLSDYKGKVVVVDFWGFW